MRTLTLIVITFLCMGARAQQHPLFVSSENCMVCHNGLVTHGGEDVSLGANWSASIMANSARDPYWQASVRREMLDHPESAVAIEDECATCHMPMARFTARANNRPGEVFAHFAANAPLESALARDGVSCSLCHQIQSDNLGDSSSFVGGFHVDTSLPLEQRRVFGPFNVDEGHQEIMRSATGFQPGDGTHIRSAELCATCHTLVTDALGGGGNHIGKLFEQMPYQEWQHSADAGRRSCQDCHMPVVEEAMPITSVLGQNREGLKRHDFRGGNFFMQRMLNRYRDELGVSADSAQLELAAQRTEQHLRSGAAGTVSIDNLTLDNGVLQAALTVHNASGHKLPTAYPSRRLWLQVQVRDADGNLVFESGHFNADGSITGNDNDEDANRYEPHHTIIDSADQVQIYESIIAGADDKLTTGLLTATHYVKDNRLLPPGFDKATAAQEIAPQGEAAGDVDFTASEDKVEYRIKLASAKAPFTVSATLWYQPLSYRWATNLGRYDAAEIRRFSTYYQAMADSSAMTMDTAERVSAAR